jgi:anthranilate 1,2-dioxygenase (deaminating, decarboxylating) large subunit
MAGRKQIEENFSRRIAAVAAPVRTLALLIVWAFWALATPSACFAQVQLPAVNLGETNFEDGFAAPGWLIEEFPESYVAGELRDGYGNTIPGRNRITTDSTTTHVAYISKKRVFGGSLAGEVLQPLVDVDVQLANGTSSRVRGFGDLTFGPGLQWAPKKIGNGVFVHRFAFDLTVPTGTYSDRRPVNIGDHFVVVNPYYAATYERKKIEFSARFHYLWNSANNDPFVGFGIKNMQPGHAFHVNYATSYELLKNMRLGFNGYWLQQVTDHQINGVRLPNSLERTVGIGPGIQFSGRDLWFRLNSYMETDVRNRPSGIKVTFRISKALPSKRTE